MKSLSRFIRFDAAACRQCRACELVCSLVHEDTCSLSLSRLHLWTHIADSAVELSICRQCPRPRCLSACSVGAITVSAAGIVRIDAETCTGCGDCVAACPFNARGRVLFVPNDTSTALKCDLCDGEPQCVLVCPTLALTFTDK